jgi:hypothetical protein
MDLCFILEIKETKEKEDLNRKLFFLFKNLIYCTFPMLKPVAARSKA